MSKIVKLIVILSIIMISCVACKEDKNTENPNTDVNEEEEKKGMDRDTMMPNGLTFIECSRLIMKYDLRPNEDMYDKDFQPTENFDLYATEESYEFINVLNFVIYDRETQNLEFREEMIEYCENYGFTTDNRITIEWVLENRKEAISFIGNFPVRISSGTYEAYYRETGATPVE